MAVTIQQVRDELNDITVEELADDTITSKIDFMGRSADRLGLTGTDKDDYVLAWAAYYSFIVSRSYKMVESLNVELQRDLRLIAQGLKEYAEELEEEILGGEGSITESTPMWDDKPVDPNSPCSNNTNTPSVL